MGKYDGCTSVRDREMVDITEALRAMARPMSREQRRYETASRVLANWNEQTHSLAYRKIGPTYGAGVMADVAIEIADALLSALEPR